jgi:hypothetical protein
LNFTNPGWITKVINCRTWLNTLYFYDIARTRLCWLNKKRALSTGHKYRASNSIIVIIYSNGVLAWIANVPGFYKKWKMLALPQK